MKYRDYVRLSKISLKARKKTTRGTVRGISFGLILLMPLLFIIVAFHVDLNNEVNKDSSIRVFNIELSSQITDERDVRDIYEGYQENLYALEGIDNVIKYNQYTFDNGYKVWNEELNKEISMSRFNVVLEGKTFSLDEKLKTADNQDYTGYSNVGILIIDTSYTDNIFLKSDESVSLNNNPLVAGKTFSENSSKEVMVSSDFLSHYDLDNTIIGKKITLNYQVYDNNDITTSKTSITGDFSIYNNIPINIFKEYTIVGVYDSKIYDTVPRRNSASSYSSQSIYDTYFWLTTDSVYNATEKSYIPEYIAVEEIDGNGSNSKRSAFYYPNDVITMSKNAINDERVFIPCGLGANANYSSNGFSSSKVLISFDTYAHANSAISIVNDLYAQSSTSTEELYVNSSYMCEAFSNYNMFYNIFTYVSIILGIFGGIIFFATLLNLYNTIHYSVQSRKNYLGLSRAIGMKNRGVINLYFTEIFQIFKRSYIWTAIFGGGICVGICFLFKMIMESDAAAIITINLSLDPIFILVAFLILVIVNTIISIIFALVACYSVTHKPILDVLSESR